MSTHVQLKASSPESHVRVDHGNGPSDLNRQAASSKVQLVFLGTTRICIHSPDAAILLIVGFWV